MYHSITFGEKNTWEDWHLVPVSRPVFNPPSLKKKTIDIQGGDGLIDLTEALAGYPLFNNREGSFEFIVMNDYLPWTEIYSMICDYIHGRSMKAVLEDEPDYYYEGRFTVNSWKSEKAYSKITIDYSVAPYKKRFAKTKIIIDGKTTFGSKEITRDIYGNAPVSPKINVAVTDGCNVHIKFINDTLGIGFIEEVSKNTTYVPDMVLYGESVKIGVEVAGDGLTLQDSNGEEIRDSSNGYVEPTASGYIQFECEYGRL